jgi:hypothetical protein
VSGNYTDEGVYAGTTLGLAYGVYRYSVGADFAIPKTPIFIEAGYLGDRGIGNPVAPSNFTHNGFNAGLGLHF